MRDLTGIAWMMTKSFSSSGSSGAIGAARNAIGGAGHLRSVVNPIAQPDTRKPFLGARAGPSRKHEAQRRAVHGMDRPAVLGEGQERVLVHGLHDGHPARDRVSVRRAGGVRVRALVRGVDNAALHACRLEHVGEADPFHAEQATAP